MYAFIITYDQLLMVELAFPKSINVGGLLVLQRELFDRWKLYHFAPVGIGENHRLEHEISLEQFLTA